MFNAFHVHKETYGALPDSSFPVHDTENDTRWNWLALTCDTWVEGCALPLNIPPPSTPLTSSLPPYPP